jgi:hypothetical protein
MPRRRRAEVAWCSPPTVSHTWTTAASSQEADYRPNSFLQKCSDIDMGLGGTHHTGPLLDDAEKDRLATMMRWRGKPPEVTPEELQASRRAGTGGAARAPKSRRELLQELFDDVVREVEERQEYLWGMQACGKLQEAQAKQVGVCGSVSCGCHCSVAACAAGVAVQGEHPQQHRGRCLQHSSGMNRCHGWVVCAARSVFDKVKR